MSEGPRCPSPERLRALLDGNLPAEELAEVGGHLEGCAGCRRARALSELVQRLKQGEDRPAAAGGAEDVLRMLPPAETPGRLARLGPYELVEFVGRGSMGVVFKAFEPALGRYVAVKVLAPYLATSAVARQRFAREAKAAAAVLHEHVVAIHAVGEEAGLPYLVMEYVGGRSLQQRIDRTGPLGQKEILRIGMQAAAGLAAAHKQGLVHRDVKPANLLLENGVERVRIVDFGLARASEEAGLTQTGVVAGTPQYMAPEQAKGEPVDHRADLFSLGSVLYAMCTGDPPFRGGPPLAVVRRVCDEAPRPVREVNPEVPEWLAEVVAALHARDPAKRLQSAEEVAELLGQHLAHLQQPASVPPPRRLTPPVGRARHAAGWAAGVPRRVLAAAWRHKLVTAC